MKFTSYFIVALIAVVFAQTANGQSNHAQWGNRGFNDTHVFSLNVNRPSRILQQIEETIVFPPPGVIIPRMITSIQAFDQKTNGNGATATIVNGGVFNNQVTLRLKSKRGHGINFQLEIHTTPQCP